MKKGTARMVKIEGMGSDPDGLYEKYRVFKEPTRDSQGNEPPEHPVSLDPPTWLSVMRSAVPTTPDFQIIEQLEEVTDFVFVLKPSTDHHARVALAAYAWSCREDSPQLFSDLLDVLDGNGDR